MNNLSDDSGVVPYPEGAQFWSPSGRAKAPGAMARALEPGAKLIYVASCFVFMSMVAVLCLLCFATITVLTWMGVVKKAA